jgi:transcriptional regulator
MAIILDETKGEAVADERGGEVIKGTLEMIILEVLQREPMHGWGITELIERRSDGLLSVNQGSLYPALYRLVARGWVSSEWSNTANNRSARYYSLTRAGRKQLAAQRAQWEKLSRGVDLILSGART